MDSEVNWLEQKFREAGGVFDNLSITHRNDRGFGCESIDKAEESTIFCPEHLLIDIGDVRLGEGGLSLDNPGRYGDSAEFLNRYLGFHFSRRMLDDILALKTGIESITDTDKALLSRVNLPQGHGNYSDDETFIISRIKRSHCLECKETGKQLIMPFVSFLNHDQAGVPFQRGVTKYGSGVSFTGKFDGEALAFYNHSDPLALFTAYCFVSDAPFVYSLPMGLSVTADKTLRIERDLMNDSGRTGGQRWPSIRVNGAETIVSWFPLYCEKGPVVPAKLAATVARQVGISGEQLLYIIIRHNLSALYPLAFQLGSSHNPYCRLASEVANKQLELISRPLTP